MTTSTDARTEPLARALLAENHQHLSRAVKQALEAADIEVDTAADGQEADAQARACAYDLILLSANLPLIDGATLVRNWRTRGLKSSIIALTTDARSRAQIDLLDLGADVCLAKPFSFEELLARVRALLRRGHRTPDSVLMIRDLKIDSAARTVRRADRTIQLTPRQFCLLHFLAQHRGKVVTRSMIWDHLYDNKDRSLSNIVDVHIRHLRTKIDRGFDQPLVLTARGRGYMLRGDMD